jgi:RNA polymerase sigma factor (sigma-70 family)
VYTGQDCNSRSWPLGPEPDRRWRVDPLDSAQPDAELVRRARVGDSSDAKQAYEALVRAHTAVAHRMAVLLAGRSDAEDIVQEAFVKAYRALPRLPADVPFRPWLLRIVRNEASNSRRSAGRRGALLERAGRLAGPPPEPSAEEATLVSESRAVLLAAVDALPGRFRDVVVCRYLLDLSEVDTCEVLGLPKGTVKSRLSRALRQLRSAASREVAEHG